MIYEPYRVSKFDIEGQLLLEDVGLLAQDFDFLPDGSVGYIKGGQNGNIGIFHIETGESEILAAMPNTSNRFDIAYSAKHNALLWAADTVAAMTDIETGQTTILKEGRVGILKYHNSAASTNGYLAYKTCVVSPSISVSNYYRVRNEIRFINADGTNERTLVLDFQ